MHDLTLAPMVAAYVLAWLATFGILADKRKKLGGMALFLVQPTPLTYLPLYFPGFTLFAPVHIDGLIVSSDPEPNPPVASEWMEAGFPRRGFCG